MSDENSQAAHCVLLAHRDHGLTEGIRSLLDTAFETVVMVASENSLCQSASRMSPDLVVADLTLTEGDACGMIRRVRTQFPLQKLILLGNHDDPNVIRAVIDAGANGYVLKRAIADELMSAVDAVLAGHRYLPGNAAALGGGAAPASGASGP